MSIGAKFNWISSRTLAPLMRISQTSFFRDFSSPFLTKLYIFPIPSVPDQNDTNKTVRGCERASMAQHVVSSVRPSCRSLNGIYLRGAGNCEVSRQTPRWVCKKKLKLLSLDSEPCLKKCETFPVGESQFKCKSRSVPPVREFHLRIYVRSSVLTRWHTLGRER